MRVFSIIDERLKKNGMALIEGTMHFQGVVRLVNGELRGFRFALPPEALKQPDQAKFDSFIADSVIIAVGNTINAN